MVSLEKLHLIVCSLKEQSVKADISALTWFKTLVWRSTKPGFAVQGSASPISSGTAAECGASGFSGFSSLARASGGSDRVLVFTGEIYGRSFIAQPAQSALSLRLLV